MNFKMYLLDQEISLDLNDGPLPSRLSVWLGGKCLLEEGSTHYGYIHEGSATVVFEGRKFPVSAGYYFCLPGEGRLSGDGRGFVASRLGFNGVFGIGGPIENYGRLKYIDGASDSVLLSPSIMGDPCLNFLHLPKDTNQTTHTHPSIRIGLIVSGTGVCKVTGLEHSLHSGALFVMLPNTLHSFHTTDDHLRIVVYHPDSAFGPSHGEHPMLNATLVDGQAASVIRLRRRLKSKTCLTDS